MRIGGAPERPLTSTSHPAAARTRWRAAARQVVCAAWHPVTRAKLAEDGEGEKLFQPGSGDLFGDGRGGTACVDCGVLVPGGSHPVGGESGREGASDHPAEESASGGAEKSSLDARGEFVDHLGGGNTGVLKGFLKAASEGGEAGGGGDGGAVQIVEMTDGVFEGAVEDCSGQSSQGTTGCGTMKL